MSDLLAALALVLVLEGLFLFAAPGAWRRAVEAMLAVEDRQIRRWGGAMVLCGLVGVWWIRG